MGEKMHRQACSKSLNWDCVSCINRASSTGRHILPTASGEPSADILRKKAVTSWLTALFLPSGQKFDNI